MLIWQHRFRLSLFSPHHPNSYIVFDLIGLKLLVALSSTTSNWHKTVSEREWEKERDGERDSKRVITHIQTLTYIHVARKCFTNISTASPAQLLTQFILLLLLLLLLSLLLLLLLLLLFARCLQVYVCVCGCVFAPPIYHSLCRPRTALKTLSALVVIKCCLCHVGRSKVFEGGTTAAGTEVGGLTTNGL